MASLQQPIRGNIVIRDFSPGQNNEYDPRAIMPNNPGDPAEAVRTENWDITEKGALITAPGFEDWLSIGTGLPGNYIGSFKTATLRHLLSVSNEKIFFSRKTSSLVVHSCDSPSSTPFGTWSNTGDMGSLSANLDYVRGSGSVQGSISASTGQAAVRVASLSAVNLSPYDRVELFVYLSNRQDGGAPPVDVFTNMKVRIGSSSTDYWERTYTQNANGETIPAAEWSGFKFDLTSLPAPTGSPDLSNIKFIEIEFNYGVTLSGTTIRIDEVRAFKDSGSADDPQYESLDVTGKEWKANPVTTKHINGVNYIGDGSVYYHILANVSQNPVKVKDLGDGMLITRSLNSAPVRSYIIAQMLGFLFIAKGNTVYYSSAEDEDDFGGGGVIGFTSRVIGLVPTINKELLVILDDNKVKAVRFQFDDVNSLYIPVKGEYEAGIGGLSHKSIQHILNDSMFMSTEGIRFFGQPESLTSDNQRINSLSWKIDKLFGSLNRDQQELIASYHDPNRKDVGFAMPMGTEVQNNNQIFVYKRQYGCFLHRSGINLNHATQHRENRIDEVYFVSENDDSIYKFNNDYSYAGGEYRRRYKFKTFNMGFPNLFKAVEGIDVAGAMPRGSEFYVVVSSDGETRTFKVSDSCIIDSAIDRYGFIGAENIGDEYIGGAEASGLTFTPYRFYQQIQLSRSIIEGREFEIELFQETAGQPVKIDFFRIKYIIQPDDKIPQKHINNEIVDNISTL